MTAPAGADPVLPYCPNCGGEMVLAGGGIRCSRWPQCRHRGADPGAAAKTAMSGWRRAISVAIVAGLYLAMLAGVIALAGADLYRLLGPK